MGNAIVILSTVCFKLDFAPNKFCETGMRINVIAENGDSDTLLYFLSICRFFYLKTFPYFM
jgi:hypothetical protein